MLAAEERRKKDREHKQSLRLAFPGVEAARRRKLYAENPAKRDRINAARRKNRAARPEILREYERLRRAANVEIFRARDRRRRPQKRQSYRLWWNRKGEAQRRHKLAANLRVRIWHALKGNSKAASTKDLLGCSFSELRAHLESQFSQRPGMSWKTYGFWHVDHVKPCASFDLQDPAQQRECFHYTNLQPLWAVENLRKNRYAY